jgi:hypothetical protein
MPPINGLITPTTTNVAAETIRTMHAELADAGLPIRSRTFQHANARTGDRGTRARLSNSSIGYKRRPGT